MIFLLLILGSIFGLPLSPVFQSSGKIVPFFEANAGLFTFIALLVAAWPVFTYFVNRKRILSLESRPYVQMTFHQSLEHPQVIRLLLKNYGRLPATKINITAPGLERPGFGIEDVELPLSESKRARLKSISWLKNEISVLPPGQEFSAVFGFIQDIFDDDELKQGIPESVPVKIMYSDPNGREETVSYDLSLTDLIPLSLWNDFTSKEAANLENIARAINSFHPKPVVSPELSKVLIERERAFLDSQRIAIDSDEQKE